MLTQPPTSTQAARRIAYVVILAACGILAPLALTLGLLIRRGSGGSLDYKERWRGVWAFAILFGLAYGLVARFFHPYPFILIAILAGVRVHSLAAAALWVGVFWLYNGFLAPAVALVCEGLVPTTQRVAMAPRQSLSSPRDVRVQERLLAQGFRQAGDGLLVGLPEELGEHGMVGRPLGGNLWQWVIDGFFVLPLYALRYHAALCGRSGTGKSELLRRIAYMAAKIYRMKVLWIDGKGDWKDGASFQLTMEKAGCKQIGVFPLVAHNGWRGSRQDILNLLMATQIFESDYYQGVTQNILKFALYAPGLPPIRDSTELLRRIYPPVLAEIYDGLKQSEYLAALSREALWGPYGRYSAFFSGVIDRLDGEKGFGDYDAAYYLLDKKRLQLQIAPFARFLIEDFQLYLALRQVKRKKQRILLVLDDFSAYSNMVHVVDLYERVRSAGGCVIVAAQGYEGLGTDAERILEGAATTILHRCSLPEKLIRVAGKRKVPEIAVHLGTDDEETGDDEEVTGSTMRMVDEPLVEPDEVRNLEIGESFFLCGNASQKVMVERVMLDEDRVEELTTELIQQYEGIQENYEAAQIAALTEPIAASQKSEAQEKKQKKRKVPPPQPPQPAEKQVATSVVIHSSGVVIHSTGGQLSQDVKVVSAQQGVLPAVAQPPAPVPVKAKSVEPKGSPAAQPPKPRSLDDIE